MSLPSLYGKGIYGRVSTKARRSSFIRTNNTVKKIEAKRSDNETENAQTAWKALMEKYHSHDKLREAVYAKMGPDEDPNDFFFGLNECR